MRRKLSLLSMAVITAACGGGGSTSAPTAPTVPDSIAVSTSPAPGATIHVGSECTHQDCTGAITFSFTVAYHQQTAAAEIYYQLMDGAGRQCAFAFTDAFNLPANQPIVVRDSLLVLECEGTFTTTKLRATLFGPNIQQLPVAQRPGLFAAEFNGGFTFIRPVAAPAPTPTPRPTPPPAPSATCDGQPVPSRCTVGDGPPPPTAKCQDGQWSCSQDRSGTCSGHGGVACYVCPGPLC
jgi:hypothetical protein